MSSIAQLYSLQSSASDGGIQGYHIEKKYFDHAKLKEERLLTSKEKPKQIKIATVPRKTTFIDQVQKKSSRLPAPTSYENLVQQKSKIKVNRIIPHTDRKTYFQEIQDREKKKHIPGVGSYGKIITEGKKEGVRSNLSQAQSPTYVEASMRKSIQSPGVGAYNAYRAVFDHRGTKWVLDKDSSKEIKKGPKIKFPPVGTYNPEPQQFRLFSGIQKQKKSRSKFNQEERFKSNSKDKKMPFYNVLSEWGMKSKLQKRDIMSRISSPSSGSKSIYY